MWPRRSRNSRVRRTADRRRTAPSREVPLAQPRRARLTGGGRSGPEARQELQATKARIRERMKKLTAVQRGLTRLATEISINEEQIALADRKMKKINLSLAVLEVRAGGPQGALN